MLCDCILFVFLIHLIFYELFFYLDHLEISAAAAAVAVAAAAAKQAIIKLILNIHS